VSRNDGLEELLFKLDKTVYVVGLGLQALILVPTRELAIQIFQVFETISKYHNIEGFDPFSLINHYFVYYYDLGNICKGGVIFGGQKFRHKFQKEESWRNELNNVGRVNVLIGTPGKILCHLEVPF